jgi:FtsP/CotA-like multicopper oxidase with cupredoxin domain
MRKGVGGWKKLHQRIADELENPMNRFAESRRQFLKATGLAAGALWLSPERSLSSVALSWEGSGSAAPPAEFGPADYTLHIKTSPIEIAPNRIISVTTYNGQFPGSPRESTAARWGRCTSNPVHLHRHSFELTRLAGMPTAGVLKDVVMVGGYQEVEVDFIADDPGLTLFHCHQQLHMDFGFMTLFDYV